MRTILSLLLVIGLTVSASAQQTAHLIASGEFLNSSTWSTDPPGLIPNNGNPATQSWTVFLDSANTATLSGGVFLTTLNGTLGNISGNGFMVVDNLNLSAGSIQLGQLHINNSMNWSGGTLSLSGSNGPPTATWSGSDLKTLTGVVNNDGALTISGNNIDGNNCTLFNVSGGVIEISGSGDVFTHTSAFGNPLIHNLAGGTLRKTGTGTANIDWMLVNQGTLEILGGALKLNNGSDLRTPVNLSAGATLDVGGGLHTLRAGGAINGPGIFIISGGTVRADGSTGSFTINTPVEQSGGFLLDGAGQAGPTIHVNNTYLWSGGTLGGNAVINLNGNSFWNGPGTRILGGKTDTLKNFAEIIIGAPVQANESGRGFSNVGSSAVIDLIADGVLLPHNFVSPSIVNGAGSTFRKSAGTGVTTVQWNLDNQGTLEAETGTLRFQNGTVTLGGTQTVASGATLEFNSGTTKLPGGGLIGGSGNVLFSGATAELTGSTDGFDIFPKATLTAGTLGIISDSTIRQLTLRGGLDWSGGTLGQSGSVISIQDATSGITSNWSGSNPKVLGTGADIRLIGSTVNLTGTRVQADSSSTLVTNTGGSVFNIAGDGIALEKTGSTTPSFTNEDGATFRKSAGTGTSIVDWRFNNRGAVAVDSGTLELRGFGNLFGTGEVTIANGAVLDVIGLGFVNLRDNVVISGQGVLRVSAGGDLILADNILSPAAIATINSKTLLNGGTITVGDIPVPTIQQLFINNGLDWTSGTLTVVPNPQVEETNLVEIRGASNWSGPALKILDASAESLSNFGTITLNSTALQVAGNHQGLTNLPGGTFNVTATGDVFKNNGPFVGLFVNFGSLMKSSPGTTIMRWSLDNRGDVDVSAGTLSFQGVAEDGGFLAGAINTSNSGKIQFLSGDYVLRRGGSMNDLSTSGSQPVLINGANLFLEPFSDACLPYTITNKVSLASGSLGGRGNTNSLLKLNGGLDWTNGTLGSSSIERGRLELRGTSTFSGATTKLVNSRAVDFTNFGTINLTAGNLRNASDEGGFTNASGGIVNISATGTVMTNQSALNQGKLINDAGGLIRKTSPLITTIEWDVVNSGVIAVDNGVLSFGGDYIQAGGTLNVGSSGIALFAGPSLFMPGNIGGTGTFDVPALFHSLGRIGPGFSPGTLTFTGSLHLADTSTLEFELGAQQDLINVGNSLTLDGILNVLELPGFDAGTYTLVSYGGSLVDNSLDFGTLPAGFGYQLFNDSVNRRVQLIVTPVPEAGSLLPMLTFAVAWCWRRRRNERRPATFPHRPRQGSRNDG